MEVDGLNLGSFLHQQRSGYFLGKWSSLLNWVNASRVFSWASRFLQLGLLDLRWSAAMDTRHVLATLVSDL